MLNQDHATDERNTGTLLYWNALRVPLVVGAIGIAM